MRRPLHAVLLLVALFSVGCGATRLYEGPARPAHEVVRIRGQSAANPINGHLGTSICAIDGRDLPSCETHVEFLPGRHALHAEVHGMSMPYGEEVIEQEFGPGERWLLGIAFHPDGRRTPALIPEGVVTAD